MAWAKPKVKTHENEPVAWHSGYRTSDMFNWDTIRVRGKLVHSVVLLDYGVKSILTDKGFVKVFR